MKINLEQWLKKNATKFTPENFEVVKETLSKYDQNTLNKVCNELQLKAFSEPGTYTVFSPSLMLFLAILGVDRLGIKSYLGSLKIGLLSLFSAIFIADLSNLFGSELLLFNSIKLTASDIWLSKLITLGSFGIWWFIDLFTVKSRTQKQNFKRFVELTS